MQALNLASVTRTGSIPNGKELPKGNKTGATSLATHNHLRRFSVSSVLTRGFNKKGGTYWLLTTTTACTLCFYRCVLHKEAAFNTQSVAYCSYVVTNNAFFAFPRSRRHTLQVF